MSQPMFYVSPEQQAKDRAEFARAGIAKGRSVIVARYADGIVFVAENRSASLHKISEIYDRIGFAAVGRYNEFENLRVAGIRHADVRGYAYDRRDVTAHQLVGAYSQVLGSIFSAAMEKPYEVELVVAEVGLVAATDAIYRLDFDGSIADEAACAVMGGRSEIIADQFRAVYDPASTLGAVLRAAIGALAADASEPDLTVDALEVAVLDRTRPLDRKFRRLAAAEIEALTTQTARPRARRSPSEAGGTAGTVPFVPPARPRARRRPSGEVSE